MTGFGIEEKDDSPIAIPNGGFVHAYDDAGQCVLNLQDDYSSPDHSLVYLNPQRLKSKPSHQLLPSLSIPHHLITPPTSSGTPESETPASLSSPLVGIVDLSRSVKTTESAPVTHGGFSDIYKAEWERTISEDDGSTKVVLVPVCIFLLRH